MDRAYRLKFCEQCIVRNFNPQKGIVCSLTNEHATFDKSCPDYKEDSIAKANIERFKEQQEYLNQADGSLGLSKYGIKNGFAIAAICTLGGCAWLFGGIIILERLFIYPFFLIGFGMYKLVATIIEVNKQKNTMKINKDMLDENVRF